MGSARIVRRQQKSTALTLLSKFRKKDFLPKLLGNEKWILHDNSKRIKS